MQHAARASVRAAALPCLVAEVLVPAPHQSFAATWLRCLHAFLRLPAFPLRGVMATVPQSPGLRAMRAYYARANEVEGTSTDGTIVAYYCRAYGFSKVVANMGALAPSDKQELMGYMDQLERNKAEVRELGIQNAAQGAAVVASFARKVFDHGDTEDRLGNPDSSTARSLAAAGVFLDTLSFFEKDLGDKGAALLQEFQTKGKFAKWRAAEIGRAIKAGAAIPPRPDELGTTATGAAAAAPPRTITASICSGSTEGGGLDAMFAGLPSVPNMSAAAAAPSAAATVPAPAPMLAPTPAPMPTPTPAPMVAPIPAPVPASMPAAGSVSRTDQVEAQKHAKYAVSALQFNDTATAIKELREALQFLGAA